MKFIYMCISLVVGLTALWGSSNPNPESIAREEFVNTSSSYYDSYYFLNDKVTSDYVYTIILGVKGSSQYYDIFLYTMNTDAYALRVKIGSEEYSATRVSDGYYRNNGIINSGKEKIEVYMFNGFQKVNNIEIPLDYSKLTTAVYTGLGTGPVVDYLEPIAGFSTNLGLAIIVSVILIFSCLITLGIVYVVKRGKYNIGQVSNEKQTYTYRRPDEIKIEVVGEDEDVTYNKEEQGNEDKPYYESLYEFKEEEKPIVDVKTLLNMNGYKTDYQNLTKEEKNDVMVYLMILKNTNKITDDVYYEEVASLWKE